MRSFRLSLVSVLVVLSFVAATASPRDAAAAPKATSTTVELYVNLNSGATSQFFQQGTDGQLSATPFTLQSGQTLVVTDVLVTPNAIDGLYEGNVDNVGGNENRIRFRLESTAQAMLHLQLGSGVVFSTTPLGFAFASNPGGCVVRLLGTLEN